MLDQISKRLRAITNESSFAPRNSIYPDQWVDNELIIRRCNSIYLDVITSMQCSAFFSSCSKMFRTGCGSCMIIHLEL